MRKQCMSRILLVFLFAYVFGALYFYTQTNGQINDGNYADLETPYEKNSNLDGKLKDQNIKPERDRNTNKEEYNSIKTDIKDFNLAIRESAKRIEAKLKSVHPLVRPEYVNQTFLNFRRNNIKQNFDHTTSRAISKSKRTKTSHHFHVRKPTNKFSKLNYNFQKIFKDIFLYSSFIDLREEVGFARFIIVARSGGHVSEGLWCFFNSSKIPDLTFVTEVQYYETCESHMKDFAVYVASCEIPTEMNAPDRVILANGGTIRENITTVPVELIHNSMHNRIVRKFGICVPPLFGNIDLLRLTEFFELSKLLGVEHITVYRNTTGDQLDRLLHYYEKSGFLTYLPWSLALETHEIWYHGQSAAIWDCLFRNMYITELVSFNDIDEYILPRNVSNWNQLVAILQNHAKSLVKTLEDIAVYRFRSAFFDPFFINKNRVKNETYGKLLTMNATMRTVMVSSVRTKMLVYPPRVFELGIHHLSRPIYERYQTIMVPQDLGLIHHYRHCDWNYGMNCENISQDETMFRYKDELYRNVMKNLEEVRKFPGNNSNNIPKNMNKSNA